MKKILLFCFALVVILSACKKYEDGPFISFRSRKERVANTWVYKDVFRNDTNITAEIQNSNNILDNPYYTFTKDGGLTIGFVNTPAIGTIPGTWEFTDKDEKMKLTIPILSQEINWKILRLKEEELWVATEPDSIGKDKYEYHFKPQ